MKLANRSTDITLTDLDVNYEDDPFDTGWTYQDGNVEKLQVIVAIIIIKLISGHSP